MWMRKEKKMINKNEKMTHHATFLKDGELYLKLVYEVEDKHYRKRIIMPKISLGFFENDCPEILTDLTMPEYPERYISNQIGDFPLCNYGLDEVCLYEQILEERYEELTIDEIEKRLGHKIKIVKGK